MPGAASRSLMSVDMATVAARESYFTTGLEVLADLGVGGLKLAEVCSRLGVTTGSFYHYFSSWAAYTKELIEYWREDLTVRLSELFKQQPDPRKRMQFIISTVLALPHSAEAAIRAWSSIDPQVHAIQVEVDQVRFQVCYDYAMEICGDHRQAELFAYWSVYLLVGYEQTTLKRDPTVYEVISSQMCADLEAGRFAGVPPT